jgi:hypothetical protein
MDFPTNSSQGCSCMNCCTLYAFDGTILHKNFKKSFCNKFQYKPDAVSASFADHGLG